MGHRLTKIYTRTGDAGTTGLGDGSRVAKNSARVEALGAVDELNSCLGVLLAEPLGADLQALLTEVQHDLFDLGGELSIPGYTAIRPEQVARLEQALDHHNETLEPLKEFILPGGSRRRRLVPPGAHDVPARRAPGRRPCIHRDRFSVFPTVPEPLVGPAVRGEPRAQPARRPGRCPLAPRPGLIAARVGDPALSRLAVLRCRDPWLIPTT